MTVRWQRLKNNRIWSEGFLGYLAVVFHLQKLCCIERRRKVFCVGKELKGDGCNMFLYFERDTFS
jgi:hypothetical protein